jgi:serine/threonine-protein kinase PpkA
LKPENILFREDGSAVLTDFGVARAVSHTTRMTNTGMVVGTPYYMSPEQARGAPIDGRADIYSLGVVFYEMLTNAVPFQAEEAVAIAIKHLTDPIPRLPARHSLYQSLIDRFLAKDPDQRFQRGLDVVDAIDQLTAALAGKPAAQTTQLNNTSVRVSSLLRALLMTLYGTLSDKIAAAWARWRDKPLHENHPRAEQATIMRIHQVIQQAPVRKRRQWLFGSLVSVSLLLGWLLFSLISHKLQWQSDSALLNGAADLTARLLLPEPLPESLPEQLPQQMPAESETAAAETDITPVVLFTPIAELKFDAENPIQAQAPAVNQSALTPETAPMESLAVESGALETEKSANTNEAEARGESIATSAATQQQEIIVAPPKPLRFELTIEVEPADALVRIMNISPRYRPGIQLQAGNYDLEVSKPGYNTLRRWVAIEDEALQLPVKLEREYLAGKKLRSSLSSGGRGPQMIVVKPGSFTMGNDKRAFAHPAHRVTIRKPFAISTHEITFNEYDRYAEASGAALPGDASWGRADRPVINVSWQDAQDYASWLSKQTGRRYRLASEAEWEYAARGGVQQPFWWGSKDPRGQANCRRGCASEFNTLFRASSAPVGHYAANRFGLYDTAGNVAEWVQDCYLGDYNRSRSDGRVVQIKNCELRSVRGGSMREPLHNISADYRIGLSESAVSREIGFRVVMELD